MAEKNKVWSMDILIAINRSIVVVKAEFPWLAHALVIAMAQRNSDPKCASYRDSKALRNLLKKSGRLPTLIYLMTGP